MASALEKLRKASTIKDTAILSQSVFFEDKDRISVPVPILNVALGGSLFGGLTPGLTMWAGPSKHFKTSFSLLMAKAYLDKYPEAVLLFYDSEFGTPQSYFKSFGIDADRVVHTPITDIEVLKHDLVTQMQGLSRGDKVIILIDSIGNLASKKEMDDALEGKTVADMTRAKQLKSLFRMVTPYLTMKNIPLIAVNHTYKTLELYAKDVVGGGCVVEGTKIRLADGSLKSVEDFVVGDLVETKLGPKRVSATWNPTTLDDGEPECFQVVFDNPFVDNDFVVCSDKHKFLVNGQWVEAKNLSECEVVDSVSGGRVKLASVTPIGRQKVYDLSVEDAEHYVLEHGVVTHNTGSYYSSDNIFIVGRRQEKDGDEVSGYSFIINVEKSRYVKEKSKIPVTVLYDGGISRYSGIFDLALESGHIVKAASQGFYQLCDVDTGEVSEKKLRRAAIETDSSIMESILNHPKFDEFVIKTYRLAEGAMIQDVPVFSTLGPDSEVPNE